MGESKKRPTGDEEVKDKKKRRSGVDTISWLKEKTDRCKFEREGT